MASALTKGAWYAMLAVAGVAAVGVPLDYQTRTTPLLAAFVPEPFVSHANRPLAVAALVQDDTDAALEYSRAYVRSQPMPSDGLSLLGSTAASAGQNALASKAFSAGAQRGWRDSMSQIVIFATAVSSQEWPIAALRLDALERSGASAAVPPQLRSELLAQPEGREALATQFALERNWFGRFLAGGEAGIAPGEFADTVRRAVAKGATADCPALSAATLRLMRLGAAQEARAAWSAACGKAADTSLAFTRPSDDGSDSPFAWRYPSAAGIATRFKGSDSDGVALEFRNRDPRRRTIATRYLDLPEGRNTIRFAGVEEGSAAAANLRIAMTCLAEGKSSPIPYQALATSVLNFSVPAGCPVQAISLTSGQTGSGWSRIAIEGASGD